ncbi:MAG: hypothetical protein QOJ40_1389 [Verrucomicrobiota bacterium]
MGFSSRVCYRAGLLSWLIINLLPAAASRAGAFSLESAGIRYGFPADTRSQGFKQVEAFLNCNLPLHWTLFDNWPLQSRLDASLGWLGRDRADAVLATLGPTLVVRYKELPLSLEGGASVTGLSRDVFGTKDLGSMFQFTSHIGLNWNFAERFRAGYRFQHMSNAGISEPNPGLNLHVVAVSYLF